MNELIPSTQVPPFTQGLGLHSLLSDKKNIRNQIHQHTIINKSTSGLSKNGKTRVPVSEKSIENRFHVTIDTTFVINIV